MNNWDKLFLGINEDCTLISWRQSKQMHSEWRVIQHFLLHKNIRTLLYPSHSHQSKQTRSKWRVIHKCSSAYKWKSKRYLSHWRQSRRTRSVWRPRGRCRWASRRTALGTWWSWWVPAPPWSSSPGSRWRGPSLMTSSFPGGRPCQCSHLCSGQSCWRPPVDEIGQHYSIPIRSTFI